MEERGKRTMAKVVQKEGHFYVQRGEDLQEIDPILGGGEEVLRRLDGMDVELAVEQLPWVVGVISDKVRIVCYLPPPDLRKALFGEHVTTPVGTTMTTQPRAAGLKGLRPTCYLPRDWLIRGVEEQVRINLVKELAAEGILTQAINERLGR